jgi:hypothetical protein
MTKNDKRVRACIQKLYSFRSKIPANLTVSKVKEVWRENVQQEEFSLLIDVNNQDVKRKTDIAKKSLKWVVFKPWVKFVGISGSVGSEFVDTQDDIDLFIVVKNDRVWIYRLYIYLRNLFRRKIRAKGRRDVKDKLCLNFLIEQRALKLEEDVFILNELLYLKPIYNKKYLKIIFLNNQWLADKYLVSRDFLNRNGLKIGDVKELTERNYFLFIFNFIAFTIQVIFMLLMRHEPDLERLWRGFREGRIEFYPKDFRKRKIEEARNR